MAVLRPNAAAVAAKVIDGEAIIMNLTNGAYYSMDGVGAAVWEMIEQGRSLESIRDGLAARYAIPAEHVHGDVKRLVEELLVEQLVIASPADTDVTAAVTPEPRAAADYRPPMLNKYTEMADLLALDPPMPVLGGPPPGNEGA